MNLFSRRGVREFRQGRRLSRSLMAVAALALASSWGHGQDVPRPGAPEVVVTTDGPVVGLQAEHVQSFRGIPYAAPPINELRFRPAARPVRWTHPRDARVAGAACPQVLDLDDPAEDGDRNMSEDCLTVNVWTPRADTEARPATMELGSRSDVAIDPYGAERRAWREIPSQKFEQAEAVRFADLPAE